MTIVKKYEQKIIEENKRNIRSIIKNRDPEKYAKYKWLVASYYEIEKIKHILE